MFGFTAFLANAYIKKYRPFPSLSEAINVAYWPKGTEQTRAGDSTAHLTSPAEILPISMNSGNKHGE